MEITKNYDYMKYTYLHRKSLQYYIRKYSYLLTDKEIASLLERAKIHDLDKQTLYLTWDKKKASAYHKSTASHHTIKDRAISDNCTLTEQDRIDILESLFDFECSALTKPDKPLNAYDTVQKYFKNTEKIYLPYLQRLHLDSSYIAVNQKDLNWLKSIQVTPELILAEIKEYLATTENNIYTQLKDKCMSKEAYQELINS